MTLLLDILTFFKQILWVPEEIKVEEGHIISVHSFFSMKEVNPNNLW